MKDIVKDTPRFSIITVVYNDVENIEETIKSVINQSYDNFEYIIIDGGSNDGTIEKIEKYREKIDCFVSEKDDGIYDAMNKGIKKAKGEFLFFLNSNDFLYNENVLKDIAKISEDNKKEEIVYGRQILRYSDSLKEDNIRPQKIPKKEISTGSIVYHQAVFVKKSVFERIGIFSVKYKIAADYDFFCRCFVGGINFFCVNEIVSIFTHGGRSSRTILSYQESLQIIRKYFGIVAAFSFFLRRRVFNKIKSLLKRILFFYKRK